MKRQISFYDALCIADAPDGYPSWARTSAKAILQPVADGLDVYGDIKPPNEHVTRSPAVLTFFQEKLTNLAFG